MSADSEKEIEMTPGDVEESIDRRESLTRDEFLSEYRRPRRPVILPNAAKQAGWSALKKWTPEFLKESVGESKVLVRGGKYHVNEENEHRPLAEVIDAALASSEAVPAPYMYGVYIADALPVLMQDISDLDYYFPDRLRSKWVPKSRHKRHGELTFLVGGKGARFPEVHYDNWHMDVFITQVCGDKEFIVFSPDQAEFVYQDPQYKTKSLIPDIENVDLEEFPKFRNARPIRIHVKEGETIFLPTGWWHTTKIPGFSVAVSMNSIYAGNWEEFSKYFWAPKVALSPLKRTVKRLYLKLGGVLLSLKEAFT